MRKIELISLDIRNFKGIEHEKTPLSNRVEIYGRNGTGKTTILDAFLWCLFGKDGSGASDFSVKPKNPDGTDVQHKDVEVLCELRIDGEVKAFKRRFVEKWTTPRGAKEPEFRGHEGEYYVNDVPLKAGDYAAEISKACQEELFKLITSAGAFNKLKDADRRRILSAMADEVSDLDLAADFPNVLAALKMSKTISQYRDEIKAKKRRISDEKEQYPARLKENADMRPDPVDFPAFEAKEAELLKEAEGIEKKLAKPAGDGKSNEEAIADQITDLETQMRDIEQSVSKEREKKRSGHASVIEANTASLHRLQGHLRDAEARYAQIAEGIYTHEKTMQKIREEWATENSRTCDVNVDSACPTCGTPYSAVAIDEKRDEIVQNFNRDKLGRLEEITKRGDSESAYIEQLKKTLGTIEEEQSGYRAELAKINDTIAEAEKHIAELPSLALLLDANAEYCKLRGQRDQLKAQLNAVTAPTDATMQLHERMAEVKSELASVRKELAKKGEIERADLRREELLARQAKLGQEIAALEAIEYEIQQFSLRKTDIIEASIARKFKFVRFKMFEYNITNDGVKEVCVCTVDGVPYPDLNTAMQINADIDIINALSDHYGIYAPVFIDHAESINRIEETKGQRIDLYATLTDDSLRIVQK